MMTELQDSKRRDDDTVFASCSTVPVARQDRLMRVSLLQRRVQQPLQAAALGRRRRTQLSRIVVGTPTTPDGGVEAARTGNAS